MLVTDNDKQFSGSRLREFYEDLGIEQCFTSVEHPQANREAEVTNRTLLQGLKVRLNWIGGSWVDELYHVLWAYRTIQRILTGKTPFNLAFRTETVIPVEIRQPAARC